MPRSSRSDSARTRHGRVRVSSIASTPGGGWRRSPPGWGRARVYMRRSPRREGLAARRPLDARARRQGRGLVLATHAAPLGNAGALRPPLQGPHRLLRGLASRRNSDRARAALPVEVRRRRRNPPTRPDEAVVDRRRVPPRRAPQLGHELRADVSHGLGGRADPCGSPQRSLRTFAAPVAWLLRAKPGGRADQPPDERRRGDRSTRNRWGHEPRPKHADARRHGDPPFRARLALSARRSPSSR